MEVERTDSQDYLASEIIELFATQPTGTPITIPWKNKTADDKEKLMKPVSENSAILSNKYAKS